MEKQSSTNSKQLTNDSSQAPFGRRKNGQPNPDPRHLVIAGVLFMLGALFIVSMIVFNVVPETDRKISGSVLALIFAMVGGVFLHTGLRRK